MSPSPSSPTTATRSCAPSSWRCVISDQPIIAGQAPIPGPIALGHEFVAEVIEVGDRMSSIAPGELAVVPFQISCGECGRCRRGVTANCARELGAETVEGPPEYSYEQRAITVTTHTVAWDDAADAVREPRTKLIIER